MDSQRIFDRRCRRISGRKREGWWFSDFESE